MGGSCNVVSPGLYHERKEAARSNVKKTKRGLKIILLLYILGFLAALSVRYFCVKTQNQGQNVVCR